MVNSLTIAAAALFVHAFGIFALSNRIEPFMYNFYAFSWWSYISFVDAVLSLKLGRFVILNRNLPYLVVVSCAFWCLFELINLRLKNWFYINVPGQELIRFFGYLIAFGTVMPGICVTERAINRIIGELRVRPASFKKSLSFLFFSGFLVIALVLFFPRVLFALTWVFLIPIVDVINYRRGYASFIRDMEEGKAGRLVSTLLAGMVCGFLWEIWNYWAISKWIYSVPLFEDVKLFEMPVLGYLGFAFFAVETVSFSALFSEAGCLKTNRWIVVLAALILSTGTFSLIERYTVFSRLENVDRLEFISLGKRAYLKRQEVRSSYAIDTSILDRDEREFLDLLHLKGLGLNHVLQLKAKGINSMAELSRLTPDELCTIIQESEKRRCRVYIKAAIGPSRGY